jgi:hypothetical protein
LESKGNDGLSRRDFENSSLRRASESELERLITETVLRGIRTFTNEFDRIVLTSELSSDFITNLIEELKWLTVRFPSLDFNEI